MGAVKVPGLPRPKGSWKCVGRGGKHRLVEQVPSGPWRAQVEAAGRLLAEQQGGPIPALVPVSVLVTFTVPLPKSIRPEDRLWPALAYRVGDADKLGRSVLDSLTRAGVFADDGQVCDFHSIKAYPHSPAFDVLPEPGAIIRVTPITESDTLP